MEKLEVKVGQMYLLDFTDIKEDFNSVYRKYHDRLLFIKETPFQTRQYEKDFDYVAYLDCIEDEKHRVEFGVDSVLYECLKGV